MGILFAISIAALLALLWAAFQMARHIRRARRRQRSTAEAVLKAKIEIPDEGKLATAITADQNATTQIADTAETPQDVPSETGNWNQLGYNRSGIIGNSFTGTRPKI